ncbi:LruC domain-containing protein [Parabacteroides johnsonii]|nr:LruC domain-containing protein [Parabacteroides johnsonii]
MAWGIMVPTDFKWPFGICEYQICLLAVRKLGNKWRY